MRTAIAAHELLPEGLYLETLSIGTGRVSISASSGTRRCVCPLHRPTQARRGPGQAAVLRAEGAAGLGRRTLSHRWGNYFNQELFGRPSNLLWAVEISPAHRPAGFADAETFHPTFLYESVWDALVCVALLWVARRFARSLKAGDVFLLYISLYSAGRFFVETLRIDPAFLIGGSVRGNLFVSSLLALGFALVLLLRHSRKAGPARGRGRPGSGT